MPFTISPITGIILCFATVLLGTYFSRRYPHFETFIVGMMVASLCMILHICPDDAIQNDGMGTRQYRSNWDLVDDF